MGLREVVMAERRNVGDEGEGAEEDPTQRMIERIWESLTEIRIQQMKREQFRTLQQRNLSVLEYQMRFIALSRYAPYVVTDNIMMVEYFIRGLRPELQDAVIPLMCRTVEEAAQRAAILERTVRARQGQSQSRDSFKEVAVEVGSRVFSREVFSRAAATDRRFQKNHSRVRQGSLQHIQLLDVIIVGSQDI
ncbi:hypothetical protein Taro_017277 [Colocasia esculenta]|uniref:Retrotransposon gag domain-containing protein n=1 Tax=Colocasia esculenta TaxID=4460 RepID=A0A843UMQ0_COLES|nr:hypothetical protein [Colocasia esculenta]